MIFWRNDVDFWQEWTFQYIWQQKWANFRIYIFLKRIQYFFVSIHVSNRRREFLKARAFNLHWTSDESESRPNPVWPRWNIPNLRWIYFQEISRWTYFQISRWIYFQQISRQIYFQISSWIYFEISRWNIPNSRWIYFREISSGEKSNCKIQGWCVGKNLLTADKGDTVEWEKDFTKTSNTTQIYGDCGFDSLQIIRWLSSSSLIMICFYPPHLW